MARTGSGQYKLRRGRQVLPLADHGRRPRRPRVALPPAGVAQAHQVPMRRALGLALAIAALAAPAGAAAAAPGPTVLDFEDQRVGARVGHHRPAGRGLRRPQRRRSSATATTAGRSPSPAATSARATSRRAASRPARLHEPAGDGEAVRSRGDPDRATARLDAHRVSTRERRRRDATSSHLGADDASAWTPADDRAPDGAATISGRGTSTTALPGSTSTTSGSRRRRSPTWTSRAGRRGRWRRATRASRSPATRTG